jgi:hypothetical protein
MDRKTVTPRLTFSKINRRKRYRDPAASIVILNAASPFPARTTQHHHLQNLPEPPTDSFEIVVGPRHRASLYRLRNFHHPVQVPRIESQQSLVM